MSRPTHKRRNRKRKLRGLSRGPAGRRRLRHLNNFLTARADTAANGGIGDTAAQVAFTADNTTNILTSSGHGLSTGQGPFILSNSGGALPAGLSAGVPYWVEVIDANTFYLHTSRKNVTDAAARVEFTDDGTGTQNYEFGADLDSMQDYLLHPVSTHQLATLTDIDDVKDFL